MTLHTAMWVNTIIVAIAAIATTSFPILYGFRGSWRTDEMGRTIMLAKVSLALIVDLTLLFRFWVPNSLWAVVIVNFMAFSFIAVSSLRMTVTMLRLTRKGVKE